MYQDNYKTQDNIQEPLAYLASSDPGMMYSDQATKQPDRKEFLNAEIREVNSHLQCKHWKLFPRKDFPKGQPRREKETLVKSQVYKWKARLNAHGGQQEYGVDYLETYSPVITWFSIRTLLNLVSINKWHSRQVEFFRPIRKIPLNITSTWSYPIF